ncbi:MAG TPA: ABC transporter substrate-binding protein [Ktedonobacteraceae bacterium]|jgi:polar amino acid transport system substrate-binding protein|nr:ABC transporter substrate-binding protein [Ktedonobacteraceae bacterium]
MSREIDRRTFLKRMGQASGLVVAGSSLEVLLAACGGNISTGSSSTPTPGVTPIGNAGLKTPGVLQWGSDFVDGAPYVFKDPNNPSQLIGFEVEIAVAMANLMRVRQVQVETCYGELDQALAANKFDMVMNGWEITDQRKKVQLFSDPYYRYGQQIVVRADDPRFAQYNANSDLTLSVLDGLTVGTGDGYKAAVYLQADPKITTKLYNGDLPFDDVKQKKIDATMLDVPIVAYYVEGAGPGGTPDPALKPIGKPLYPDVYVCGFNKSNPNAQILLPEINAAIAVLKKNGTLKNIYKKWSMWNDQQAAIGIM